MTLPLTMAERSLTYTNPLGAVTLRERIEHARRRVLNARLLNDIHPEDRAYAVALESRQRELRELEALLPPSKVPRKRGKGA